MLAQVSSRYDGTVLELQMPGGEVISGEPRHGELAHTELWGRAFTGPLVNGPVGRGGLGARQKRAATDATQDAAERGLDSHAVSMLSQAAVDQLGAHAGRNGDLDARRFRPDAPDRRLRRPRRGRVGGRRRPRRRGAAARDPPRPSLRADDAHPETGERDADTLRWMDGIPPPRVDGEVCCGVYADVDTARARSASETRSSLWRTA